MILAFRSALDLATEIREGRASSREVTDYFIGRIERFDGKVNAVVVRDFERARRAADEADRALSRGEVRGLLHGLPMTAKEAFDIAGLPTTLGNPDNKDFIPTADTDVVVKLKSAGTHFIGKTNVPLALTDTQSFNDIYGTTNNPYDLERVPGGSSGGSAAALAAGLTGLEVGSDVGGSIRIPAHFCGVYGHKPTQGIVSSNGRQLSRIVTPSDLAVRGPMARSASDLAAALDIITGAEPLDRPGWKLNLPRPAKKALSEYRVAVWPNEEIAPVQAETSGRVQAVADRLASLGAKVTDTARPDIELSRLWPIYLSTLRVNAVGAISDQAFVKLQATAAQLDSGDLSDTATMVRAAVQSHREWMRANNERELLRIAWRAFFDDWDILICPTLTSPAFAHDHEPTVKSREAWGRRTVRIDEQDYPYFRQLFWTGLMNLSRLPSTVFPTGLSQQGLPIGLQAVGAEYNDYVCIDFARLMADEFGGFCPPEGYED